MNKILHFTLVIVLSLLSATAYSQTGAIMGDTGICQGYTTTLSDTTLNGKWYSSDTSVATIDSNTGILTGIHAGSAIIIYITMTRQDSVTMTVYPLPVPQITINSMILGTTVPYVTYQWYRNWSIIPNATNSTYTLISDGNYFVVVSDSNGCSDTSSVFFLSDTAVSSIAATNEYKQHIPIFPNPAHNVLYIKATTRVHVTISSLSGKILIDKNNATSINISSLPNAQYTVSIYDQNGNLLQTDKLTKVR